MPLALLAALAASLITHASALFMPDMDWLPSAQEESPTLHAELHVPAAHPPDKSPFPEVSKKPSKRAKNPKPPMPEVTPSESATAPLANTESPPPSPVAVEDTPPPKPKRKPPPPPGNSGEGLLSYRVYRGSNGFLVGQSAYRWRIADGQYSLSTTTETKGLAGLFYPLRIELQSEGEFGPDGFIPHHFRTLKQEKPSDENADFDWEKGQLRLSRDNRERPLSPGSQDMVSFVFQLTYLLQQLGSDEKRFPLHVASGKRYDLFQFSVEGKETLETPAGSFRTLHLKAIAPNNSSDTTEVWLALDRQQLAVKIRFTDRNGDSFEQVLETLETETKQKP